MSTESTGQRAVRGTVISLGGQMATQVLRLASNIILARFLPESAFGLSQMVFALTTGLWLISDVGIGASVIRSHREDDDFIHTAWTLSVVRGFALFLLGTAAGPVAAWFYDEPQLLWLLPFCSLMVLLLASESTSYWVQHRRMQVGRPIAIDLIAQIVALAVSVPLAIKTQHVISLAAPAVVSAFVKFVLTHTVLPGGRMKIRWDKSAVKEIFDFGQWIFISTMFSFMAGRWDTFSLARLQGFAFLGVYSQASNIVSVPNQIAIQVTNTILTPVLSDAFRGSIAEMRERLKQARRAYLPAGALLFLGAATTAPAFFLIAYKPNFHAAGPFAQLLILPAWMSFVQEASSRALLAAGDGRGLAKTNAIKVVATVLFTLVGFSFWGFWGFLGGHAVGALVGVIVVGIRLRMHGVFVLAGDLVATAIFTTVGAAACLIPVLIAPLGPKLPSAWFGTALPVGGVPLHAAWWTLVSCAVVCGPLALVVLRLVREARANANA